MEPMGHWFIGILAALAVGKKLGYKRGVLLFLASTISDTFLFLEWFGLPEYHAFMHTLVGLILTGAIVGIGATIILKDYSAIIVSYVGVSLHAFADLLEGFFPEKVYTIPLGLTVKISFLATLIPVMFILGILAIQMVVEK